MLEIEQCPSDNDAQEDSEMHRPSTCVRRTLVQVCLAEAKDTQGRLQAAVAWWRSLIIYWPPGVGVQCAGSRTST